MVARYLLYDKKEALRYFRAKGDDKQAENACDLAYLKLRNEVMPRFVSTRLKCHVIQCSAQAKGKIVLENGLEFCSSNLAKHLDGCTEVLLFGATLGSKFDVAQRRIALEGLTQGAAAQAVGAALIEHYCDTVEEELKKDFTGVSFRWRFSPGYGDWDLEEQKKVFAILNCNKIGLTLTASGMMAPIKSVTAIIGIDYRQNI
ncbi:MAG: Vitamin B12 dependent methionine synthase activation subunit [Acidaminococcaceae bacterium]|jgi:hypothetical protein|nr:Vitamin B12 dependent methionine synthase activation subunit [Acidaminococcaceae bacterium]